ncbi:scaffold attachment factor B2-like [Hyla sarda]|uniref:scaffold attachment factor B2-like n=1 Tax=Hyla sarda TaxID=327740 RepID=UPI0024C2397D|nr:scaffold attachment factor B2-like [Hyla sarda]
MADEQPSSDAGASTEVETKKLSELRVIDLKAELKKRNLDTGGNKSALTERLKRAIEEEGGNPDQIQLTSDTPSKKTPKRSGRVPKHEEVDDNGVEDDSGDSQENEDTSQDQENEKVLKILGENDKCEQLKEEVPEVEDSVNQEDSSVEAEKPKEEEVFVTIESADSTLDLDGESNHGCEDEESKDLASDDRDEGTDKDTDFEMIDLDKTSDQSSQIQSDLTGNLENEGNPPDGGEVTKESEDVQEERSAIRESSSKEDDQKMSSTDDEPGKSITKDEKGQIDASSGKNLWVSGLSSTTRATDLKNLFSKYGKVVGAKVVTNARSPGARCYGFVTMSSSEDATKCINHLHRTELHGRMISVEKAKNEPAGKKSSDKKENESKREKSLSQDRRHSTENSEKSSPNKKDVSDKGDGKSTEKDKNERRSTTSDRSRTSKSGSRGAERKVVMDKSKGEPVISVKASSERSSKSQDRKSASKEKSEILSFDKIKKQREHERQRQREREIREMERQRERDKRVRERILMAREREEREKLRRERVRLEFERERLERERMERERLERERMRIEEERRIEQDRIQREREELRRQQERLRYEQDRRSGVRRPYDTDFRRDDSYWPESKRMAMDDRYHDFGRLDRYQDFTNRDRGGRYMDHLHNDRRDDSRSGLGGRDNYPDRHMRETREGWGEYNRHMHEGRNIPPHGRGGRGWGDHGRKIDTSRPGDRGAPPPSGQGQINRGGIHGNFPPNENSQNMSSTMGPQGGGNFAGQNRPNDERFPNRY